MKKVTTLVLMLCFILSGALCFAHGTVGTENEKDGRKEPCLERIIMRQCRLKCLQE